MLDDMNDAMILKRLLYWLILKEIERIREETIYNLTYVNILVFKSFISNIENHSFSSNGLDIIKVGLLLSYNKTDYSCFDTLNNK
jgi:hypothetical protein